MFQVDEGIEVGIDQFNKRISRNIDIGVICTDHVANTLEDKSGLPSEKIKWNYKHVFDSLLFVFHAG